MRKVLQILSQSLMVLALLALPMVTLAVSPGFASTVTPLAGTATGQLIAAIRLIANFFLVLVAIIALIILVLGGVRYITSQGDEDAVASAKNTILYAGVGLLVIGLSAAIVNFVLNSLQGA